MPVDRHAELVRQVEAAAARAAGAESVELVAVAVRGPSRRRLVRVDIDRAGPRGVDLDDCKRVSNTLGRILDDEEILSGGYVLEVSSPGTDRPIETAEDFRRNTGRRVVVTTVAPIEGRREFRGVLAGATDVAIIVEEDTPEAIEIPFDQIARAQQDVGF